MIHHPKLNTWHGKTSNNGKGLEYVSRLTQKSSKTSEAERDILMHEGEV